MSHSTFAARFAQLVGQPPMQYLTNWRMVKAVEPGAQARLGEYKISFSDPAA